MGHKVLLAISTHLRRVSSTSKSSRSIAWPTSLAGSSLLPNHDEHAAELSNERDKQRDSMGERTSHNTLPVIVFPEILLEQRVENDQSFIEVPNDLQ